MTSMLLESDSERATEDHGADLAQRLVGQEIILLHGDLGSGKTAFVRGMARALGVDRRQVQSPSFSLIHEYDGTEGRLIHIDLYRLRPEELDSLDLDELFADPCLKAVEWAERLPALPANAIRIDIETRAGGRRQLRIDDQPQARPASDRAGDRASDRADD